MAELTQTKILLVDDSSLQIESLLETHLVWKAQETYTGGEPEEDDDERSGARNGLFSPGTDYAVIHTGIARGYIDVTAQTLTGPPGAPDTSGWDTVIDVSYASATGAAYLSSYEASLDLNLAHAGPGPYRLRIHTAGRDAQAGKTQRRSSKPAPSERYLIQSWPEPIAPDTVHKDGDRLGQQLRDAYAGKKTHLPPRESEPLERDDHEERADRREAGVRQGAIGPYLISVSHHLLYLLGEDQDDAEDDIEDIIAADRTDDDLAPLVGSKNRAAVIQTGIHTGDVEVTVRQFPEDPGPDAGRWSEVREAGYVKKTKHIHLVPLFGMDEEEEESISDLNLAHAGKNFYQFRVHANGRAEGREEDVQDTDAPIIEQYLIQIWPVSKEQAYQTATDMR